MNDQDRTVKLSDEAAEPPALPERSFVHNTGWLVSVSGQSFEPGRIEMLGKRTLLGTTEECDVRLKNDPTVSRRHAEILLVPNHNHFYVRDLNATNCVRLNGRAMEPNELRKLMDNDELTIGGNVFLFKDLV